MRRLLATMMQTLVDAEATAFIGADPHERSESRTTQPERAVTTTPPPTTPPRSPYPAVTSVRAPCRRRWKSGSRRSRNGRDNSPQSTCWSVLLSSPVRHGATAARPARKLLGTTSDWTRQRRVSGSPVAVMSDWVTARRRVSELPGNDGFPS
jgi:hypothetical protein